jgi:hypothetical protein
MKHREFRRMATPAALRQERARAEAAEAALGQAAEERGRFAAQMGRIHQEELAAAWARAEAVETALREAEGWIQEVDHVEDCAAADRTSSRACDCGRTAILKRTGGR